MNFQKNVIIGVVSMMLINTTPVLAANNSTVLVEGIKTLESSIDSGKSTAAEAIDAFSKTIVEKNISLNDVNTFVKTKMTAQQYSKFQEQMNSAIRGIDPETLTSTELGEMVGQSLAAIRTEGLYWTGCTKTWTAAALIAAALIAASIAKTKSKSVEQIQNDYNNKRANTTNAMNKQIADMNNWQQAYPRKIQDLNADIRDSESDISYNQSLYYSAQSSYYNATTESDKSYYSGLMSTYQSRINSAQSDIDYSIRQISYYSGKIAEYSLNPGQVALDAAATAVARDNAIANLNAQEQQAIADAPANQALGKQLRIGAGIGGAIGVGLGISAYQEGRFCL